MSVKNAIREMRPIAGSIMVHLPSLKAPAIACDAGQGRWRGDSRVPAASNQADPPTVAPVLGALLCERALLMPPPVNASNSVPMPMATQLRRLSFCRPMDRRSSVRPLESFQIANSSPFRPWTNVLATSANRLPKASSFRPASRWCRSPPGARSFTARACLIEKPKARGRNSSACAIVFGCVA